MHYLIDISKWQGKINFDAMAAEREKTGFPFGVIVRVGYGIKSIDPNAHTNLSELKKRQIPVGFYWYAPEPITVARVEPIVNKLNDFAKIYKPEYPIFLDIEGAQDWGSITQVASSFIEKMAQYNLFPGLYGSEKVLWANLSLSKLWAERFSLWVANYGKSCGIDNTSIWQFTSSGSCSGISGNVDKNRCYVDYKKIIKEGGYNYWNS